MAEQKKINVFSPETHAALKRMLDQYRRDRPPIRTSKGPDRTWKWKKVWAKITDHEKVDDTYYRHAWTEQRWNITGVDFEDEPDPKEGTIGEEAANYLLRYPPTKFYPNGTIVEAIQFEDPETGENVWIADKEDFGLKFGTVTAIPECAGYVTVERSNGDETETWTIYLKWGEVNVPKKNFLTGSEIAFLPIEENSGLKTGLAVQPNIDGMMFRKDGENLIQTTDEFNLINTINGRGDFDVAKFASEFCDDETQINLEWKGIQVLYGPSGFGTFYDGIRKLDMTFDSSAFSEATTRLETTWEHIEFGDTYSSVTDLGAPERKGLLRPILKVPVAADNVWIRWNPDTKYIVEHIGPDADSATDEAEVRSFEKYADGVRLKIRPGMFDAKGHWAQPAGEEDLDIAYTEQCVVTNITSATVNAGTPCTITINFDRVLLRFIGVTASCP